MSGWVWVLVVALLTGSGGVLVILTVRRRDDRDTPGD